VPLAHGERWIVGERHRHDGAGDGVSVFHVVRFWAGVKVRAEVVRGKMVAEWKVARKEPKT
jgi:hypothetical protein